jgi:hypothetical protein
MLSIFCMYLEEHLRQALASSISFGFVRRELASSMRELNLLFSFTLYLLVVALDPFLVVAGLIGEGRVDLNVGFTFSLGLSW